MKKLVLGKYISTQYQWVSLSFSRMIHLPHAETKRQSQISSLKGYPLEKELVNLIQHSCLEVSADRVAWQGEPMGCRVDKIAEQHTNTHIIVQSL